MSKTNPAYSQFPHVSRGLFSYKYANVILRLARRSNNIYIEIGTRVEILMLFQSAILEQYIKSD